MTEFLPDKSTYIRAHAIMMAIAMAGGMVVLWAVGNPHIWTGAVGGIAAVLLRGWYVIDEAMGEVWSVSDTNVLGPGKRTIPLASIETVRSIGSAVQLITTSGDKYLIKYQADPPAVINLIKTAIAERKA